MPYNPFGDKSLQTSAISALLTGIMQGYQQKKMQEQEAQKQLQAKPQQQADKTREYQMRIIESAMKSDDYTQRKWAMDNFKKLNPNIELPPAQELTMGELDPMSKDYYKEDYGDIIPSKSLIKDFPELEGRTLNMQEYQYFKGMQGRKDIAGIRGAGQGENIELKERNLRRQELKHNLDSTDKDIAGLRTQEGFVLPKNQKRYEELIAKKGYYQAQLDALGEQGSGANIIVDMLKELKAGREAFEKVLLGNTK